MSEYDWITHQLRLSRDPGIKLFKIAEIIVEEEGNQSEKYGLLFGLIPTWAKVKAEKLIEDALR